MFIYLALKSHERARRRDRFHLSRVQKAPFQRVGILLEVREIFSQLLDGQIELLETSQRIRGARILAILLEIIQAELETLQSIRQDVRHVRVRIRHPLEAAIRPPRDADRSQSTSTTSVSHHRELPSPSDSLTRAAHVTRASPRPLPDAVDPSRVVSPTAS